MRFLAKVIVVLFTLLASFNEKAFPKAAIFQRQSLAVQALERLNQAQAEIKRKLLLTNQNSGVGNQVFDPEIITQLDSILKPGHTVRGLRINSEVAGILAIFFLPLLNSPFG